MSITELKKRSHTNHSKRIVKRYSNLVLLIGELNERNIPDEIANSINIEIDKVNSLSDSDKTLGKQLRKTQWSILKLIEKELKLVTKNLYQNRWMAIGLTVFGVPFGIAFGASLDNMAFISIGIPLGMAFGIAIGSGMDKKAKEEGRQLNIDVNF